MKKFLSLLLSICMLSAIMCVQLPALAADAYTTHADWNFETGYESYVALDEYSQISNEQSGTYGIGNALRVNSNKTATVMQDVKSFPTPINTINSANATAHGNNAYMEASFDVYVDDLTNVADHWIRVDVGGYDGTTWRPVTSLFFRDAYGDYKDAAYGVLTVGHFSTYPGRDTSATSVNNEFDRICDITGNTWYNIKIVVQLTEDGSNVGEYKALYVNGVNMVDKLTTTKRISNVISKSFKQIDGLRVTNKKIQFDTGSPYMLIDNFKAVTYDSADGSSPVVDKYALISAIRTAEASGSFSNDKLLKEAKAVCESESATQAEVNTAAEKLISAPKRVFYEDFENTDTNGNPDNVFNLTDTSTAALNYIGSDENIYGIGKHAVAIPNGNTAATKMLSTFNSDIYTGFGNSASSAALNGNNAYAEFSFDAYPHKTDRVSEYYTAVSLGHIYDGDNQFKYIATIRFSVDGIKYWIPATEGNDVYNETTAGIAEGDRVAEVKLCDYEQDRWYNVRMRIQLTDENGAPVKKVTAIYINGENKLTKPLYLGRINKDVSTKIDTVQVLAPKNHLYMTQKAYLAVDNIQVNKYNLAAADSAFPVQNEKEELLYAIRQKQYEKLIASSNTVRYGSVTGEIESSLTSMLSLYEGSAAESEITAALEKAKSVSAAMQACNQGEILFAESFENDAHSFSGTVKTDAAFNQNKVLQIGENTSASFGKTYLYVTDDIKTSTEQNGSNAYVATEFDIKTSGLKSGNGSVNVSMTGKDGEKINTVSLKGGERPSINLLLPTGARHYSNINDDEWINVRIVTQITGNTAADEVNRNTKFYVNGNNLINLESNDLGREILDTDSSAQYYGGLLFEASGAECDIDNVKVTKYYEAGNEPVNYAQLLTSIHKGDKKVKNAVVGKNVTEEILAAFNTALSDAKSVFNNSASLSEVEEANDKLLKAYADFRFKNEAQKIGSVSFADKDGQDAAYMENGGKIKGVSITKYAEYGLNADLYVSVYKEEGSLFAVKRVKDVLSSIEAGERAEIPLDIQLPENCDKAFVKVMLLGENLEPLTDVYQPSQDSGTIYIAGDSIVQTYDQNNWYPRDGWGAYVGDYYNNNISVNNLAVSGYTVRSYIDYQKMVQVEQNIKKGDYFIVSYLTNDSDRTQKKFVDRYDFKNLLRNYADTATENGAEIIFATTPTRLNKDNNYGGLSGGYGDGYYITLIKEVAAEYDTPVVNLSEKTVALQNEYGYEYVQAAMHLYGLDILKANFKDMDIKVGGGDVIHISQWGAKKCASWIAEDIKNSDSMLRYSVNGKVYTLPAPEDIVTASKLANNNI